MRITELCASMVTIALFGFLAAEGKRVEASSVDCLGWMDGMFSEVWRPCLVNARTNDPPSWGSLEEVKFPPGLKLKWSNESPVNLSSVLLVQGLCEEGVAMYENGCVHWESL